MEIWKNHPNYSRSSNPCRFSTQKNFKFHHFIFSPKILLENAKISKSDNFQSSSPNIGVLENQLGKYWKRIKFSAKVLLRAYFLWDSTKFTRKCQKCWGGGGGQGGSLNYFGKHGKAIKFSFNPPLILHTEINW